MPFWEPGSLSPDDIYALTAFILHLSDIVAEDDVLDAHSLPQIQMPNRDGFRVSHEVGVAGADTDSSSQ